MSINNTDIGLNLYRAVGTTVFAEAFPCTGPFTCFSTSHPFKNKFRPSSNTLEGWDAALLPGCSTPPQHQLCFSPAPGLLR